MKDSPDRYIAHLFLHNNNTDETRIAFKVCTSVSIITVVTPVAQMGNMIIIADDIGKTFLVIYH